MANSNNQLKAYVRFDGTGRVIPGSLILQRFKPKVGNWQEINANECCNDVLPSNCIQFVVNTTFNTYFEFSATSTTQEYSYTVTWGDGSSDTGSSGEGFININHTYTDANRSYTARICFSDASVINQLDFPGFD
jgi:hypothetical protein